jgi:hypothetical protein
LAQRKAKVEKARSSSMLVPGPLELCPKKLSESSSSWDMRVPSLDSLGVENTLRQPVELMREGWVRGAGYDH